LGLVVGLKGNGYSSLHASGRFISPGIAYANSFDPAQAQHIVGLDLRSKLFESAKNEEEKIMYDIFTINYLLHTNYPACKELWKK